MVLFSLLQERAWMPLEASKAEEAHPERHGPRQRHQTDLPPASRNFPWFGNFGSFCFRTRNYDTETIILHATILIAHFSRGTPVAMLLVLAESLFYLGSRSFDWNFDEILCLVTFFCHFYSLSLKKDWAKLVLNTNHIFCWFGWIIIRFFPGYSRRRLHRHKTFGRHGARTFTPRFGELCF